MPILEAAKPSLIDINFGLMFWTILTFLIVLYVLKRFAFGPIQATLDARRKAIADDIDAAETAREEAQLRWPSTGRPWPTRARRRPRSSRTPAGWPRISVSATSPRWRPRRAG